MLFEAGRNMTSIGYGVLDFHRLSDQAQARVTGM